MFQLKAIRSPETRCKPGRGDPAFWRGRAESDRNAVRRKLEGAKVPHLIEERLRSEGRAV